EAAVYLHDGWRVLGGQLVDEKGNAMGLTRLSGSGGDSSSRGEGADLVTDKNGYFLIYGPQSIDVDDTVTDQPKSGWHFYAAPGYPLSMNGALYALRKKDIKRPLVQLLLKQADRA